MTLLNPVSIKNNIVPSASLAPENAPAPARSGSSYTGKNLPQAPSTASWPKFSLDKPQANPIGLGTTTKYSPTVSGNSSLNASNYVYSGNFTGQMVVPNPSRAIAVLTMKEITAYLKLVPGVMPDKITTNSDGSISYYVKNSGIVDVVIGYRVKFYVNYKPDNRGFTVSWKTADLPQPNAAPSWLKNETYTYFKDNNGSWDFTSNASEANLYDVKFTTYTDTEFMGQAAAGAAWLVSSSVKAATDKEIGATFKAAQRLFAAMS